MIGRGGKFHISFHHLIKDCVINGSVNGLSILIKFFLFTYESGFIFSFKLKNKFWIFLDLIWCLVKKMEKSLVILINIIC